MRPAAVVIALALAAAACATGGAPVVPRVPGALETRAAQSRDLDTADTRLVLKAALNALQDSGFTIREANSDLGLVTGVAEWQSRSASRGVKVLKWVGAPFTYGASLLIPSGRNEFSTVEATVNVTSEAGRTRVRVSLVARVTDDRGRVRGVEAIGDASAYQRILARLEKALYLEREGL